MNNKTITEKQVEGEWRGWRGEGASLSLSLSSITGLSHLCSCVITAEQLRP